LNALLVISCENSNEMQTTIQMTYTYIVVIVLNSVNDLARNI